MLSLLCCVYTLNINSGVLPVIHYFSIHGSASPTIENKDEFGRLRSVGVFKIAHLSRWIDKTKIESWKLLGNPE